MRQLSEILKKKSLTIAVVESCTGGNLSALLTQESGASDYFDRGFITYSNQSKIELLSVKKSTLSTYGAVSEQTAMEMVRGVIQNSNANIAVAITGIAGPTGGTNNQPVGTVCFCFYILGEYTTIREYFDGERQKIVQSSVNFSVDVLKKLL